MGYITQELLSKIQPYRNNFILICLAARMNHFEDLPHFLILEHFYDLVVVKYI